MNRSDSPCLTWLDPVTSRRINTWIRSPGIVAFCTIITSGWLKPLPDTPPEDIIPWYAFVPIGFLCFFNGQYYAQRVIGNYYVRKTQTLRAKGIDKVELHAS